MADRQATYNILVFGFRRGLIDALETLKKTIPIRYTLVLDKLPKLRPEVPILRTEKFPNNLKDVETLLAPIKNKESWTHVIASVEGAVLTASMARRVLNARLSKDSTIIKCYDKYRMKQYLSEFNIPMTKFMRFKIGMNPAEYGENLGFPIISKQRISSGGRGLLRLENILELSENLEDGRIYESFVDGEELSVESFIHEGKIKFSNITRYYKKKFINIVPGNYSSETESKVLELNQRILDALKISWGITHCEMYLLSDGSLYFGEIAIRPPGGEIMDLMGHSYEFDSWMALLKVEMGLEVEFPVGVKKYSAVVFFHPGEGKLKKIQGEELLERIGSLLSYKISINQGDCISLRSGVNENIALVKLANHNFDELIQDAELATKTLCFDIE